MLKTNRPGVNIRSLFSIDTTANGGITSFSTATETAAITVTGVVDAEENGPFNLAVALSAQVDAAVDDDLGGLVHHSDRGVQYLSVRYTERLADNGVVNSVGSRGDSYDNALAETMFGLYKAELIHRRGPWRSVAQVELATAAWVHWWNERRLHSALGYMPPAEYEAAYWQRQVAAA